jgi:hypothetical protein
VDGDGKIVKTRPVREKPAAVEVVEVIPDWCEATPDSDNDEANCTVKLEEVEETPHGEGPLHVDNDARAEATVESPPGVAVPPPPPTKKKRSSGAAVTFTSSCDGLPVGWKVELRQLSCDRKRVMFVDPNGKRYR